jgi:hypothetical protein
MSPLCHLNRAETGVINTVADLSLRINSRSLGKSEALAVRKVTSCKAEGPVVARANTLMTSRGGRRCVDLQDT